MKTEKPAYPSGPAIPIKVVAFGDANTGKSSTLACLNEEPNNFILDTNYQTTVVVELVVINKRNWKPEHKFYIWDTSGHKDSKSFVYSYYNSEVIFIGFFDVTDVTRANTSLNTLLERAKDVQEKVNENKIKKIPLILVGAKADNGLLIDESVSPLAEDAKTKLEKLGFEVITGDDHYIPVSAKDNIGIHDDLLEALHKAAEMKLGIKIQAPSEIQSHFVGDEAVDNKIQSKLKNDEAVDNQSQDFLDNHPNVKMALAVTGLVLGIAAIATVTVLTCGVAGVLGTAAAAIAATLTLHASLTMVSIVAGGVGLFATSSIAKCAHVIHNTKSKPPTL